MTVGSLWNLVAVIFFSSSDQLELWRHCFPPVLLETTHGECETVQYEPVFLICCTAERKGQALTGSALSWMSSPSRCSSAPLRYINTPLPWLLTQMTAPRKRPRRHSLRCHNLEQAGQYFPSAVAYQPEHCTHVPAWPPPPPLPISQHPAIRFPWQLMPLRQSISQHLDLGFEC